MLPMELSDPSPEGLPRLCFPTSRPLFLGSCERLGENAHVLAAALSLSLFPTGSWGFCPLLPVRMGLMIV